MTLSQAIQSLKSALYAIFIYREPEPFNYVRDTGEIAGFTSTEYKQETV